ncbi:protein-disulfide reductase DsbD family protein [Sphingomicrobium sediminis]|uniref:Thioredoxin family protein n=1 Tax=Sphingomicrobium sediminis TaxID=2950949 RepID=A0A9X2J1Q8_9SPHN|nr:protein-disulfide reductase DsbD domain-containing protein [Sphingomicrobium sediminis]MCM8557513.1 thioredoxin family protein [Sphingomicrobium sediminis]
MLQRLLLLIAILFAAALPARAQQTNLLPSLVAETPADPDGGTVTLAIRFEGKPGWYGYWKNPGDAGLPLNVQWDLPDGVEVGEMRFPTPMRYEAAGLMSYIYRDTHAVLVEVETPATGATVLPIGAEMRWLACTDRLCVPERGEVKLLLPVGEGAERADEFDQYRRDLPRPLESEARWDVSGSTLSVALPIPESVGVGSPDLILERAEDGQTHLIDYGEPQRFRRSGEWLIADLALRDGAEPDRVAGLIKLGTGQGLEFVARAGDVPSGGEIVADKGSGAILYAILGALLGGLILNLMPCVFPVLAMKALHLAKAGSSEAYARRDALGYAAGAVVGTAALGLVLLGIRAGGDAVGWAFQLQDPRTIFILLLLAWAITLNLLGLFELPVLAGGFEAKGSFATGALAAFVATPCAGPFLGTALGTALILPPLAAVAVFASLGLGLALPFLAIGFIPALRNRMPKPGKWMETLKRWLALPMGLTVIACLWLLWRLAGPIGVTSGVLGLGLAAAALALFGRRVGMMRTAFALVLGIGVLGAIFLPNEPIKREVSVPGAIAWTPQAVDAAASAGRPVFVYFTADWCLSCKANERVAISRDSVTQAFDEADVAVFVADWTDGDAQITRFLEGRGRAGVPLYLWYAPGSNEPEELPQLLTPGMLTQRVEAAQSAAR